MNKVEKIRESIWGQFVSNDWSDDDYYDRREKDMLNIMPDSNEDNVVDDFYNSLVIPEFIKSQSKFLSK